MIEIYPLWVIVLLTDVRSFYSGAGVRATEHVRVWREEQQDAQARGAAVGPPQADAGDGKAHSEGGEWG